VLLTLGYIVPSTEANFVWLRLDEDTMGFAAACDLEGVSVRPFVGEGARVSIGSPEQNDAFLAVAQSYSRRPR
jgi:histidinol-phosphate aminotransferase